MAILSNVWLKMSDPVLTQVELKVDGYGKAEGKDARILQLRRQRRRAMRRAMSMEGIIRRLLDAAKGGTAEALDALLKDAQYIINVPLHEALKDMGEDDRR